MSASPIMLRFRPGSWMRARPIPCGPSAIPSQFVSTIADYRSADDVRLNEPRDERQLTLLRDLDGEPRCLERAARVAVRMAAVRDHAPRSLEPILPARELRVGRADVLREEELPARAEHTAD